MVTRQATLLVCLVGNVLHANEFHVLSLRSLVPLFVLPIVVARILVVAAVIEAVAIAVAVIWFWPSPPPHPVVIYTVGVAIVVARMQFRFPEKG